MKAIYIGIERDRDYCNYSDCIDDDLSIIDDDWAVCDDDRDGLTQEEAEAYKQECQVLHEFARRMYNILGWEGWSEWRTSYLW